MDRHHSTFSSLSSFAASARSANQQRLERFKTVAERLAADRETRALARFEAQEKAWTRLDSGAVRRSESYRARIELAELLEKASAATLHSGEYVWYHSLRDDSTRIMNLRDTGLYYHIDSQGVNKRETMLRRSPFLSGASMQKTKSETSQYLEDRQFLLGNALDRARPGAISEMDDLLVQGHRMVQ